MMRYLFFSLLFLCFWGCQREDFTQSGTADDNFYLKTKGFKMPVHVAGNLDNRKMLVIIHGGPGGNSAVYRNNTLQTVGEREYAVVYWDQRSAGSTQGNGTNSKLEDFREDLKQLILLLRDKYGQDQQIYIMGHSWGGFLAPYFLLEHADMVQGWIQVDGAHRGNFNSLIKDMILFYGENQTSAFWNQAKDYCNSAEYSDTDFETMKKLNPMAHNAERNISEVLEPVDLPEFDIFAPVLTQNLNLINSSLVYKFFEEFYTRDPVTANIAQINTPALLIWGKYDFVCPPALSDELMANLGSTDLTRTIYDNSGHSPMYNESSRFWNEVTTWIQNH